MRIRVEGMTERRGVEGGKERRMAGRCKVEGTLKRHLHHAVGGMRVASFVPWAAASRAGVVTFSVRAL